MPRKEIFASEENHNLDDNDALLDQEDNAMHEESREVEMSPEDWVKIRGLKDIVDTPAYYEIILRLALGPLSMKDIKEISLLGGTHRYGALPQRINRYLKGKGLPYKMSRIEHGKQGKDGHYAVYKMFRIEKI